MEEGQRIKEGAKNFLKKIKKNKILDALAKGTLGSIPVVGGFLVELYNNYEGSEQEKTDYIKKLFNNFLKLNDQRLEELAYGLLDNRKEILQNRSYLGILVSDTSKILTQLNKIEKRGEVGTVQIRLDVANLRLEMFDVSKEVRKGVRETRITRKELVKVAKAQDKKIDKLTSKIDKLTSIISILVKNNELESGHYLVMSEKRSKK